MFGFEAKGFVHFGSSFHKNTTWCYLLVQYVGLKLKLLCCENFEKFYHMMCLCSDCFQSITIYFQNSDDRVEMNWICIVCFTYKSDLLLIVLSRLRYSDHCVYLLIKCVKAACMMVDICVEAVN